MSERKEGVITAFPVESIQAQKQEGTGLQAKVSEPEAVRTGHPGTDVRRCFVTAGPFGRLDGRRGL